MRMFFEAILRVIEGMVKYACFPIRDFDATMPRAHRLHIWVGRGRGIKKGGAGESLA